MISKNKIKHIISLQKKKVRDEERLFVIEGDKIVKEFLAANFPIKMLIAKPEFLNSLSSEFTRNADELETVSIACSGVMGQRLCFILVAAQAQRSG